MKTIYFIKKAIHYAIHQPIIINEPSLQRMFACVPGWLEKGHLYCFDYAIKNLPNDLPLLEIGTFAGLSTNTILYYLQKYNKSNTLVTTDWYWQDIKKDEKVCDLNNPLLCRAFLKDSFIRNVKFFNPNAKIKSSDLPTDDFFKAWDNQEIKNLFGEDFKPTGNISFAYIDGNHIYEYAKRDFENVDKILVKGGFILFDDSADYTNWGSKKVAQEALKTGKYKIIKKNPHYFVQKIS